MSIPEKILKSLKCCLSGDESHIFHEPILLKCGGNACKKCVIDSTDLKIKCFGCNSEHAKKDLLDKPINKALESVIQFFLNDLFIDLNMKLESITGILKGDLFFLFLNFGYSK